MKFQVTFYRAFRPSLDSLTAAERGAVMETVAMLAEDPKVPGLNVHRVYGAENCWSARVNDDVRLIFFWYGSTIVPAYVGHHDDAYRWAKGRDLEVNPATGAAQVVIVGERYQEFIKVIRRRVVEDPGAPRPFAHLTDEELVLRGAPKRMLATIREATEDQFLELVDALPDEVTDFLLAVATGDTPPALPPRASDPFSHPDAKRRFYVVGDDEELKRALSLDWEQWMVFLHPVQREAVDRDFSGPARVSGGPGTGKSVVAVHRAARLAHQGRGRVLLTSFSRTLALHLRQMVDRLLAGDRARDMLDVVHLHQLAKDLYKESRGQDPKVANASEVGRLAKAAAEHLGVKWVTSAFLEAEWNTVVDPLGLTTWEEYAVADRYARGVPLNRAQRETVWPALEFMWRSLGENGLTTWSGLCWELVQALDGFGDRPYVHVIADEVQDFGPAELRLLRALAEDGRNDVFLASDTNQRIFRPYTPFVKAGLEVRGRTVTLRVNYRMTEQIRRQADEIVSGRQDVEDPTAGSVSLLFGEEPVIKVFDTKKAEVAAVADWLKHLVSNGYRPGEIAVFARKKDVIEDRVRQAVSAANLKAFNLEKDEFPPTNRVAVGTMHRSKGLQFRAVAVMGVEDGTVPLDGVRQKQPDEAAVRAFLEMERNLLYVACSRARERLFVSGVGKASPYLVKRRPIVAAEPQGRP